MTSRLVCTSPTKTIQGNELLTGVSYTQCVNSETDLQFGQVASAQISFTTTYSGITKNTKINWYCKQHCDSSERLMGYFNVTDIQKNGNSYTVTAYDNITKLDVDCTAFLKNTSANTVYSLFTGLCSSLGLSYDNYSSFIVNGGMAVNPSDLVTAGITARTVMHYIAEAVAGYIIAKPNGHIYLDIFGIPGGTVTSVTASDYSTLTIADQPAPQVSKVTVQLSNESCTSGSGDAVMQYLFNPLFYNRSAGSIQTNVDNIRKRATGGTVGGISLPGISAYYACNFHMYDDKKINAGDIISVDGKQVLVMTKKITPSGCDIICTGEPTRAAVVMENTDKISNLEANKFDGSYLTSSWLSGSSTKTFNGNIMTNDIIIPQGLGYSGNSSNTSLKNVIQYLLSFHGGSSVDVYIDMSGRSDGYNHKYSTVFNNLYSASVSSGAGVSCAIDPDTNVYTITCNNVPTSYPNNGTVTITYNGTTVNRFNITCYTRVCSVGEPFNMFYPGDCDYDKTTSKVWRGSISSSNLIYDDTSMYPISEIDSNSYLWRQYSDPDGFNIYFSQPGTYYWQCIDTVHEASQALWKFLVQ